MKANAEMQTKAKLKVEAKDNDLATNIPKWDGEVDAKAKVETQATLKVEAKDNDIAIGNSLVGGYGEGKGDGEDESKTES